MGGNEGPGSGVQLVPPAPGVAERISNRCVLVSSSTTFIPDVARATLVGLMVALG